jgi:hypothetical protein
MSIRIGILAAAGLLCIQLVARADDAAGAPAAAADFSRLIPQLDDSEFSRRQAASQDLMEAGKAVFPELEKAALEGSREASGRAIDILRAHYTRGDDETKQAAQAALERLAKSSNAGAAQRAGAVLNPPKPEEDPFNGQFGAVPIIRRAGIQIQVAAANANGGRRVSTKRDANGKVEIEAQENGKKTKIVKQPDGSIEMEVTETINGKETTKKYAAKNYDDLKKNEPEAAKAYDQYNAGGLGNIQIQAGFAPALPGLPNLPIAPAPNLPGAPNLPVPPNVRGVPNMPAQLRDLRIKSIERQLELLKRQAANNPAAQRLVDLLQDQKQELEKQAEAEKSEKPAEPVPAPAPAEAKPAE